MTNTQTTNANTEAATILERSVCLVLRCHWMGNSKSVRGVNLTTQEGEDVQATRDNWSASKKLLRREDLKGCYAVVEGAKMYLRSVSTSMHGVFGRGTHLIPIAMFDEVEERLSTFRADLEQRVQELVESYPNLIEERKQALGLLFKQSDYPTENEVKASFDLDWSYVSFSAPDRLQDVDKAAYENAVNKHNTKLATAFDEVVLGLRAAALELMQSLSKRLSPAEDGKRKVLRSTALDELNSFMQSLPKRNITDDDQLPNALEQVKALSAGVDVEQIKSDDKLRESLLEATQQATVSLDKLVNECAGRGIAFGDDLG